MLLHRFLEESAQRAPDSIALIESERRTSYGALDVLANRFAHLFLDAGLGRGDRVVIALDNSVEFVAAYFGAMKAGGVAVPLPPGTRSDRLEHAIKDCAPRICVIDHLAAEGGHGTRSLMGVTAVFVSRSSPDTSTAPFHRVEETLSRCSDEPVSVRVIDLDLAAIIYTSGSTGEPRGVMLTHRNLVANARSIVSYLGLTAADRVMCVLPFYYVYGLSLLHTHVAVGGSLALDNRFAFPNVVLAAMRQHRVTGFAGVPSTFALLLHRSNLSDIDLPDLRYVTQAGGAMPPARILEWLARGPKVPFFVMYGATEAGARLTYLPPVDLRRKLGSIGKPIPNVEIVIVRENGDRADQGEVGELVARGANVSIGYWNNPEETLRQFGAMGYRTGDLGYLDEDGFLYLVGRRHDMIKVGAHRVGAKEIEEVLHEHPTVHEVAVVGVPHDLLGEVPLAFVVLREPVVDAIKTLQIFCASRLPAHKVPARFELRSDLPKLPAVGKIDKNALRASLAAHASSSANDELLVEGDFHKSASGSVPPS